MVTVILYLGGEILTFPTGNLQWNCMTFLIPDLRVSFLKWARAASAINIHTVHMITHTRKSRRNPNSHYNWEFGVLNPTGRSKTAPPPVITQQYSSTTFVSMRFHCRKEKSARASKQCYFTAWLQASPAIWVRSALFTYFRQCGLVVYWCKISEVRSYQVISLF